MRKHRRASTILNVTWAHNYGYVYHVFDNLMPRIDFIEHNYEEVICATGMTVRRIFVGD